MSDSDKPFSVSVSSVYGSPIVHPAAVRPHEIDHRVEEQQKGARAALSVIADDIQAIVAKRASGAANVTAYDWGAIEVVLSDRTTITVGVSAIAGQPFVVGVQDHNVNVIISNRSVTQETLLWIIDVFLAGWTMRYLV